MKPCLTCGEPAATSHCAEHAPKGWQHRETSARARGYDTAWDKLSKRAREAQPFCSDAHLSPCSGSLTADHLPSAWQRKAAGKALRLRDVEVVCQGHNDARGTSRTGSARAETHAGSPPEEGPGPGGKPQGRSLSADSELSSVDLVVVETQNDGSVVACADVGDFTYVAVGANFAVDCLNPHAHDWTLS